MSNPEGEGKTDWGRRGFTMRPLSALVPAIAKPVFKKRSAAGAQLLADWDEIVGPELAATSYAKRFAAGTLTIACSSVVAMQWQYQSEFLKSRINGALGRVMVERIKFVQEMVTGKVPVKRRLRAATPGPVLADMPPGPLREALERLGAVLADEDGERK